MKPSAFLPYLLPILSGLLTAAALTDERGNALIFFSLVPLLVFLVWSENKKRAFFGGWLYGVVLWAILVKWILDLLPLDWAGFGNTSAPFFVVFSWSVTALFLGLAPALFSLAARALLRKGALLFFIAGPFLWTGFEYLASWLPTLLWMGSGTVLNPVTLGHIGYALAEFPAFLRLAPVGTVYALSFVAFLANMSILFLLLGIPRLKRVLGVLDPRRGTLTLILAIAGILLLALPAFFPVGKPVLRAEKGPLRVALISSDIPSWAEIKKEDVPAIRESLRTLLAEIARTKPDLVIAPESARITNLIETDELSILFNDSDAILFDNILAQNYSYPDPPFNSRFIARRLKTGETIASWNKSFLMMGGEYAPSLLVGWAKTFGFGDVLKRYKLSSYKPGMSEERPIPVRNYAVAVSLCTQGWAPQFFFAQKKQGADILVNMSADALFRGSRIYEAERRLILKVRAAENGSYLFHAANANPSYVIGPSGQILETVRPRDGERYAFSVFLLP